MTEPKRDFDKDAAGWDQNPVRVKLAQDVAKAITEEVQLDTTMDAMDFGCGTGLLTTSLSPCLNSITGVDTSEEMLKGLQKKIDYFKLNNIDTKVIEFDRQTFDAQYDLIVSNMTIHHIKDTEKLLRMFYDTLKEQGVLCISDLDEEGGQFHKDNTGVFHFGFNREQLQELFKRAGFSQIKVKTAAQVTKPAAPNGVLREFTIFLITGKK